MSKKYNLLLSFCGGIVICNFISIIISLIKGKGIFYAVNPELIKVMGNQLNAVILQYFLSGVLGLLFMISNLIWDKESWSLLKKTLVHLVTSLSFFLIIAYINRWMSFEFIFGFILVYLIIYFIIWILIYFYIKNKIKQMNLELNNIKDSEIN